MNMVRVKAFHKTLPLHPVHLSAQMFHDDDIVSAVSFIPVITLPILKFLKFSESVRV